MLIEELKRYQIDYERLETLSDKDGVSVTRVFARDSSYVIKCFERVEYRREIDMYKLLGDLGLKTMKVVSQSQKSLLLEDLARSEGFRLAQKDDMKKEEVARALGRYYSTLHQKGREYLKQEASASFYSELDLLTPDNLQMIKDQSGYVDEEYWAEVNRRLLELKEYYQANRTITYNDFFFGNAVIAKDLGEAYMFDYNFLGEGLAYFDLSNVMHGLDEQCRHVFLASYGDYSNYEQFANAIFSPLIGLIIAYKRETIPSWAKDDIAKLKSGTLKKVLMEAYDENKC